ncbi:MAG TPA: hypothetical protein VFZ53_22310 [Polyangiaceae bacterium]
MRDRLLPTLLAAVFAFGCTSKEFQGGGSSGAPSGGSAGSAGAAGSGAGGRGGAGGNVTGGSAGTPGCTCAPTEYCRGGECLACAELSSLDFGPPELLLDDPQMPLRFPRPADTPGSLFYRAGAEGMARIFHTPNTSMLGALAGNPDVTQQSGALFVAALDRGYNVIFDEINQGTRTARAASWNGATLGSQMEMPPPLSPGGFEDYSVAAATASGRLFWMSSRDLERRLRTGVVETGDGVAVTLDVPKRAGSGTCEWFGNDATPWVTPDGRRMLFRSFPLDDACQPLDSDTTDLFVVPLEPMSGTPSSDAIALASLNEVGFTDTDPSLSPDLCTLYFASDRGSPSDFKLYRARRR